MRVFANVIKISRDHPRLRWVLNTRTSFLTRDRNGEETQRHREDGREEMEVVTGAGWHMPGNAQIPGAGRGKEGPCPGTFILGIWPPPL